MRKYPDDFDFYNEPVDPQDVLIRRTSVGSFGYTEEFSVVSRETWNKYVEARELLHKEKQVLSFEDLEGPGGFDDFEEDTMEEEK